MSAYSGSCLCGHVQYEIDGRALNVVNCHCGLCRKMNGASFSTYVITKAADFSYVSGELKSCSAGSRSSRHFCPQCGTPIFNENPKYDGLRMIHLGSLDDSQQFEPTVNIYCDTQLDWLANVTEINSLNGGPQ